MKIVHRITAKVRALVERIKARRAERRLHREHDIPEIKPRRRRRDVGRVVRKVVGVTLAVGLTALLVVSPWTFFGLLYLGFTAYALLFLVSAFYEMLQVAV